MTGPAISGLRLVPAAPAHAAAWFHWRAEESARRFNPMTLSTVEEIAERLARGGTDLARREHAEYRWMVALGDDLVGTVALKDPAWAMGYGEIAYHIGERWHGRGVGTEAVALLLDQVFHGSDLRRVVAFIASGNVASCRLAERLGFVREGVLREHYVVRGRPVDEVVYGLLRPEWCGRAPR